ncbi:hypothetical protein [Saccharothrix sp. ALI-22-I]|uniref:hypothetical protein n=1 Tax=Saccharothrix sp. ALI-22-I TaxID=1933778 RepID=UPI0015C30B91|nr:hypothetical protein [Saccharothrix sp. ALI-22-I]
MQTKLHQWAVSDAGRRFDDLFNLVCHPDFLAVAWGRVSGTKGARTPGVDRVAPWFISEPAEVAAFLGLLKAVKRIGYARVQRHVDFVHRLDQQGRG